MKIIVDNRMRQEEFNILKTFGELITIPKQSIVYDEISAHPDIFISNINNKLICAPCIYDYLSSKGIEAFRGEKNPQKNYPDDILYNVCQIGNFVIGNFKYCDSFIVKEINKTNLKMLNVKQGYSNCSICVLNNESCITSDERIYKVLIKEGVDVCLIKSKNIRLLNKSQSYSKMSGFIGGASCSIGNNFILFGDIKCLGDEEAEKLSKFISKNNMKLIYISNKDIIDFGGIIFT